MMDPKQKLKILKDGPYLVSGSVPLSEQIIVMDRHGDCIGWRTIKEYPVQQSYSLCRCGLSTTHPFCDGSHVKIGFHGQETASHAPYLEIARKFAGPTLDLTDAERYCVGASFCDRAGGTWFLTRHSDDPKLRQIAIEEAANCPSGRLIEWDKTGHSLEPDLDPSIALVLLPGHQIIGPIWLRGGISLESADGDLYEVRNRVTLCRCDKSKNQPFCDGSHIHR
jgi:CDGSH-type Zn-finger protein